MKRPGKLDRPTAEMILEAATSLFYRRGLSAVTLDEVAANAKTTKRTLYYHFPTKDDLILEYLRAWHQRTRAAFGNAEQARNRSGVEILLDAFRQLEKEVERPGFRGCPFVNAVVEINERSHPATALAKTYKEERRAWFESLLRKERIGGATRLSEQIMALWEGAMVRALITGSSQCVRESRMATAMLLQSVP